VQGREVAVLAKGDYEAGRYRVAWDGRGERGPVQPGVYFVELSGPGQHLVSRFAILR